MTIETCKTPAPGLAGMELIFRAASPVLWFASEWLCGAGLPGGLTHRNGRVWWRRRVFLKSHFVSWVSLFCNQDDFTSQRVYTKKCPCATSRGTSSIHIRSKDAASERDENPTRTAHYCCFSQQHEAFSWSKQWQIKGEACRMGTRRTMDRWSHMRSCKLWCRRWRQREQIKGKENINKYEDSLCFGFHFQLDI